MGDVHRRKCFSLCMETKQAPTWEVEIMWLLMDVSLKLRRQLLKTNVYVSCAYKLHKKPPKIVTRNVILKWTLVSKQKLKTNTNVTLNIKALCNHQEENEHGEKSFFVIIYSHWHFFLVKLRFFSYRAIL